MVTYFTARSMKGRPSSSYVVLTGVMICLFVFQYFIYGSKEMFAAHYIILVLSVFYFNEKVSLYTFFLVIASQLVLFHLRPNLIPEGPLSSKAIRFLDYSFVGLAAAVGSKMTRELLNLTIQKTGESEKNFLEIREIVKGVGNSFRVLRSQVESQDEIVNQVHDLSQKQSSSLEEITATLEELSSNSESITQTAKSLFEEMGLANEAVVDLRKVYDLIQSSSRIIMDSVVVVTSYSKTTFEQIRLIMDRFQILGDKGTDISNFIQVINDIADKVNLLSLNASIEAARAGEYGRGFSVVADEISKLADATSRNASEIEKLINENRDLLEGSRKFVNEFSGMVTSLNTEINKITKEIATVGNFIDDIGNTVKVITSLGNKIFDSSRSIESSTNEQQIATESSSKSVQYVYEASQELVTVAMNITYSTKTISRLSEDLHKLVKDFAV
jgi:methyl-accepting chemotaxis protein